MASSTPLATAALQHVLQANGWTQDDLSAKSGIHRSTVSMHIAGQRAVRDEHLTGYLRALDRTNRQVLLAAWLRDTLGPDVVDDLVDKSVNRVRDQVTQWAPKLDEKDGKMLSWLSNEMAGDPDLIQLVRSVCRRLGFADC